ncbi:MAG: hypothetical protein ACE5HB_08520 [Terriglobia bacterium]
MRTPKPALDRSSPPRWTPIEALLSEEPDGVHLRVMNEGGWWEEFIPVRTLFQAFFIGLLLGAGCGFFWALVLAWLKWGN